MDQSQRQQRGPGAGAIAAGRGMRQRCQHHHTEHHLQARDLPGRDLLQPARGHGRDRIQQCRQQRQADPGQHRGTGGAVLQPGDQHHAGKGQHQPRQPGKRERLALHRRGQQQQEERLGVVDHGRNRDAAVGIGREQRQPAQLRAAHAHPAALQRQRAQQRGAAKDAAEEHDVQRGLSAGDDKPADGA
ncbi:hypothetical protein D3C81_1586550 [compost metagenome]